MTISISGVTSLVLLVVIVLFFNKGCSIDQKWENLAGHYSTEYSAATTPQAKIAAAQGFLNAVENNRAVFSDHAALVYDSSANHINVELNGIRNLIEEWNKIVKLDPSSTEYQMAMNRKDLNLSTGMSQSAWYVKNHKMYTASIGVPLILLLILLLIISFVIFLTGDSF